MFRPKKACYGFKRAYGFKLYANLFFQNTRTNSAAVPPAGGENGQQRELIAAPSVDELWEVSWQPSPPGTHPASFPIVARPIAGGVESKTPTASKQAYRLAQEEEIAEWQSAELVVQLVH